MTEKSTGHASTSHARRRPPALGGRGNRELLYGMHTVEAALQNPRRRILRLLATGNAARRLGPGFSRHRGGDRDPPTPVHQAGLGPAARGSAAR